MERIGFILDAEATKKISFLSSVYDCTPDEFINLIIDIAMERILEETKQKDG